MRSRLFSMAAKPQALAGHLSQLQLEPGGVADWDTARGCSAHPTAAQSHPTELSEAVGRQEGKQSREEGGTSQVHKCRRYLFTKAEEDTSHFYPPPHAPSAWKIRSSPAWLHTGSESWSTCRENQSSISTEKRLQADDEGLEKPILHSLDVKPYAVLQSPSFLLHLISSSNKLPQEPAFLRCIF